ncbi:MAG: hypothetical protein R3321_13790, partial [Nitrososphaeraceae archaeon]|nr:hypothetical protein [Nitrososphaeraceae archaeon]
MNLFSILFITTALLAALAFVQTEQGIQDIVAQTSNENEINQTSTSADKEPAIGETFVWQGTVSSMPDPLQGHESHQVTVLLPPRED